MLFRSASGALLSAQAGEACGDGFWGRSGGGGSRTPSYHRPTEGKTGQEGGDLQEFSAAELCEQGSLRESLNSSKPMQQRRVRLAKHATGIYTLRWMGIVNGGRGAAKGPLVHQERRVSDETRGYKTGARIGSSGRRQVCV